MIQMMKLIEVRFAGKSRTIICGLTALLLAVILGGIGLVFIPLPAEGQTGKGLSEADLRKIEDVTQTAMNAALAKDFATWAALFLDDGVVNPPNEPAVKGRAAIRAWLKKFPPMTEFKLNNEKVEGREDLAYVLGTYTMTITPPGAPGPVKDSGKFVTVLRRQGDGSWLCAVDMFSSDLPPSPPPPKQDKSVTGDEFTKLKSEYADILALEGTSKGEILAIARILRANPEIALDRTAASGEYCFKSDLGTMVHFATQPERTSEDVVYEFDASGLIAAGLDPARMKQLPELGQMTPGVWYFLPKGQSDPHHAHAMAAPTIALAVNVK